MASSNIRDNTEYTYTYKVNFIIFFVVFGYTYKRDSTIYRFSLTMKGS